MRELRVLGLNSLSWNCRISVRRKGNGSRARYSNAAQSSTDEIDASRGLSALTRLNGDDAQTPGVAVPIRDVSGYVFCAGPVGLGVGLGVAGRGAAGADGAVGLFEVHGLLGAIFSLTFFLGFFFSRPRWSLLPMTCSLAC
jgi:hypothetical protein